MDALAPVPAGVKCGLPSCFIAGVLTTDGTDFKVENNSHSPSVSSAKSVVKKTPAQYTNTSTAACSADFTTSSNFRSFVFASLSLADTSGTDSRKLSRKLLFTA